MILINTVKPNQLLSCIPLDFHGLQYITMRSPPLYTFTSFVFYCMRTATCIRQDTPVVKLARGFAPT